MTNLLKDRKISETPFRKEVLAIFTKYNNAIPLSVIEKELKEYNRITLYRTIKIFLEKGIIHEITINGAVSNYAICKEECDTVAHHHQHIHFKCNRCGIIFCVEVDKFPTIILPKYKIEQLEIQAIGLCENCNV
ncbi:MAG TPA: Fur family transcriptional regulator [Flavobacteriaceae bacterium]|jgi:Fur family ferric uptake transcriptional regulator|nr:Fur family transcriptional regulator [Flavobacteriaceae bacterium]